MALDRLLRGLKDRCCLPMAKALAHTARLHQDALGATPTAITIVGFCFGLLAVWSAFSGAYAAAVVWWTANRVLDGIDGVLARHQQSQTDFGGYIDIVCDFTIYALIPIAMALQRNTRSALLLVTALEAVYFVNCVSQFYLASLLEKRAVGAKATGEVTSVTMPDGLIEGTETLLFYTAWLLLPQYMEELFMAMMVLTATNIVYRVWWAACRL